MSSSTLLTSPSSLDNLLVHRGKLVMIDLPQVVDVIAHPSGQSFLTRDARNIATWFASHGLPAADPDKLARLLHQEARLALSITIHHTFCLIVSLPFFIVPIRWARRAMLLS